MKPMFNPSLMCMDLINIKEQIQILNSRADFYHVDIMDGHFVKKHYIVPGFCKSDPSTDRSATGLPSDGNRPG